MGRSGVPGHISRDALAEEGSLKWSADAVMREWQGVNLELRPVMGAWRRLLNDVDLSGTIPASLGGLDDPEEAGLGRQPG